MFRYRVHSPERGRSRRGHLRVVIKPGEEILFGSGRRFRVLEVVPFEEEDETSLVGLLQVEAA